METRKSALYITQAAMIAAIYVVIQVRISEALTILPVFTPAAIPGLFLGCLLSNTLTGCVIWDIIFGSIATLIGAIGTRLLRHTRFLCTLPPVIANAVIVPLVLKYAYGLGDAYWYLFVTVGLGEILSVCVLGMVLKTVLGRYKGVIFKDEGTDVSD